jgi:D-3-phosphoglycerate dehydrogenase
MRILNLEPDGYSTDARAILEGVGEYVDACWNLTTVDALIVRLAYRIDADFLSEFPRLKYILSATTGLDHIDLIEAEKRGIKVLSLKGETGFLRSIPATAELTWGLILSLLRNIPAAVQSVKSGEWDRDAYKGHDLRGKTLGIIGMGRVGRQVARFGDAFGMSVIGHDKTFPRNAEMYWQLDDLLRQADIISIHVPLDESTRGMIGATEFSLMKKGAYLINTSRGEVIDEPALLHALENGHLAGAAVDVMNDERGIRNPGLLEYARTHDNLIITPHIGGCTFESMAATEIFMANKLAGAVSGNR